MNKIERKMLEILKIGREKYGYVAVKAEFEAEGTRMDELLRLTEITRKANLDFALKIGGCEAVRDLMEAKQIGVEYVIAPMIETPYALSKFIEAKNLIFTNEEQADTSFLFNLETETTFRSVDQMIELAKKENGVDGIVFGRVDFTSSMNRSRDEINTSDITNFCLETAKKLSQTKMDFVVGGGVSIDAIGCLTLIRNEYLSRFETRKVVFDGSALGIGNIKEGLTNAVHFELLWLINKREYYGAIFREDEMRIEMLESRWNVLSGGLEIS